MKVVFVCTWKIRCGIAVYQLYLARALKALGHEVEVLDIRLPIRELEERIRSLRPDVLHLQYEPAFGLLDSFLPLAKLAPVSVVTCHRPTMEHMPLCLRSFKGIVVHRNIPEEFKGPNVVKMPMAAPVFERIDKNEARKTFGIPPTAPTVATFGFLSGYKGFDQVLASMILYLKERPDVWSIWLTSEHFMSPTTGDTHARRVKKIVEEGGISDRTLWSVDFLPDEKINRYLQAADLGFIWCGQHTGGNSAAALQFITARRPVVVSESDHFHTLPGACIRAPFDLGAFCRTVFETLADGNRLRSLTTEAEALYEKINYNEVAKKYLEFYRAL